MSQSQKAELDDIIQSFTDLLKEKFAPLCIQNKNTKNIMDILDDLLKFSPTYTQLGNDNKTICAENLQLKEENISLKACLRKYNDSETEKPAIILTINEHSEVHANTGNHIRQIYEEVNTHSNSELSSIDSDEDANTALISTPNTYHQMYPDTIGGLTQAQSQLRNRWLLEKTNIFDMTSISHRTDSINAVNNNDDENNDNDETQPFAFATKQNMIENDGDDENNDGDENDDGDDENDNEGDNDNDGDDENDDGDDNDGDDENNNGDDNDGDDENNDGDDENNDGDDENNDGDDENDDGDDENDDDGDDENNVDDENKFPVAERLAPADIEDDQPAFRQDSIMNSSSIDNLTGNSDEDEIDVILVKINNICYYAENKVNSDIYSCGEDKEIGDIVGEYVSGVPVLE